MPRLSVLLPARNADSTVDTAVRSTLRALPRDAELVVLDDGSTDGTAQILARFADPRMRVVNGRGSGGLGHALNTLLAATDSEFVGRMDADDICLPGRFTLGMRAAGRGADIVFAVAVDQRGRIPRPRAPLPISSSAFGFRLLLSNPVRHPTMVAKRSSLDHLGGYRQVPSEDYDLWLRAANAGLALRRLAIPGLAYRVHADQLTQDDAWLARSHADPLLNEEFARLSATLLGESFPRLVALSKSVAPDRETVLARFEACFRRATARLSSADRRLLDGSLKRRVRAVRGSWEQRPHTEGVGQR